MALNAIGGLAAGLSQGIQNGMALANQREMMDLRRKDQERLAKADERDAEIHELRKDQYASEKEIRDRRNNALRQIAEYTQQQFATANPAAPATTQSIQDPNAPGFGAPAQQQTPSSIKLAGPIPQGGLSMAAPSAPFAADNPAGALAPTPQAAPPAETMNPGQVLAKGMITGAYSPKMLTDIANIFAANGMPEEGIKYMNQAYTAQQRGAVQAASAFMQNNPEGAAAALQQGGVELEGLPSKAKPDDPEDMNWKINVKGAGERTINVRDWLQSTMDPEKFFEMEDRRRKEARTADMDERKFKLDERKTNAYIGYLGSRSEQALANADKADRYEPGGGGLRASRSSEAQINTALSRRDKAFDRVSSSKDIETGKFEVDPMRRQVLDSAANQYQGFLEDQLGEELDARQHHKFTDAMVSYPVNGTPEQIEEWQRKDLMPRMGLKSRAREQSAPAEPAPASAPPAAALAPTNAVQPPAGPKPGSLAWMKEQANARQAIKQEMEGIQKALQTPNLSVEQKKALALRAQEIAARRDALK
jgi:hypothetical protein